MIAFVLLQRSARSLLQCCDCIPVMESGVYRRSGQLSFVQLWVLSLFVTICGRSTLILSENDGRTVTMWLVLFKARSTISVASTSFHPSQWSKWPTQTVRLLLQPCMPYVKPILIEPIAQCRQIIFRKIETSRRSGVKPACCQILPHAGYGSRLVDW